MDNQKRSISETTDGKPPRPGFENAGAPAPIKENGQHEAYWVLSAQERALGFVRPVRRSYRHVGRNICGKPKVLEGRPGDWRCTGAPRHVGDCTSWCLADSLHSCGQLTTMSLAISETYARDPKYYGSTFCCECGEHLPVDQFVWEGTEERVGS